MSSITGERPLGKDAEPEDAEEAPPRTGTGAAWPGDAAGPVSRASLAAAKAKARTPKVRRAAQLWDFVVY